MEAAWDRLLRGVLVLAAVVGVAVFAYLVTAGVREDSTYCHTHPLSTLAMCNPDPGDMDLHKP